METFITDLTKSVESIVTGSIASKLKEFSKKVAEMSEGKLTEEQVLGVWNTINPNITVSTSPEAKSSTTRTATDKTRKCHVPKKSGANKGEPCGKNCVVGFDTCKAHQSEAKPVEAKTDAKPTEAKTEAKKGGNCQHVMLSGQNKGNCCGKNLNKDSKLYCTVHLKQHGNTPAPKAEPAKKEEAPKAEPAKKEEAPKAESDDEEEVEEIEETD